MIRVRSASLGSGELHFDYDTVSGLFMEFTPDKMPKMHFSIVSSTLESDPERYTVETLAGERIVFIVEGRAHQVRDI